MTHVAEPDLEEFWACASPEALQRTTDLARRAFKAPVAAITSVLGYGQIARCFSTADADAAKLRLSGLLCREVVETGRPLILRDVPQDARQAKILRDVPAAAYIGVPVRLSSGLDIGVLCVLDTKPHVWDDGDLELLIELAAFLTSQIELKLEILQREKAERALCATQAKLVAVVNRIPGLVFERRKMEDGQARYTFFGPGNTRFPAVQRLMNAQGVDLDFIHPGDRDLVRTALARSNREETDLDLTFRVQDADDEIHWLRSQALVRREADGTICWDGLCFDISDLVAARDAAEAAHVAKDALLVNVNHELRAPLQAIIGFTEFLKTETRPHLVAAHARNIQLAGDSLLAIVNQLLTKAGSMDQTTASIVAFDLRTFGESCLSMVGPASVEKQLKTRLEIDDDLPPTIALDAQKLQQALVNLLNNAVKFTAEGSITLRIARAAKGVRFSVIDTGIGIPDEKRSLLFQRFSRLAPNDETAKGSGLGLSITKALVEQMDGEIGVERHVDHGTTFWFVVPIKSAAPPVASDPPRVSRPAGTPNAAVSTGARILLADDLDLNRKLIADMLSIDGHVVDCVEDGMQAVEAATQRSYDLILMDMIMPRMDGVAATRAIRALPPPLCKVPIVALTAHSFPEQLDSCLEAGMDATLVKPMSMDALSAAVNDWTRGRKAA